MRDELEVEVCRFHRRRRSHGIRGIVATETEIDWLQTFSCLLNGHKIMSPGQTGFRGGRSSSNAKKLSFLDT